MRMGSPVFVYFCIFSPTPRPFLAIGLLRQRAWG